MNTKEKIAFLADYNRFKSTFFSTIIEAGKNPNDFWNALDSYTAQELVCELATMKIVLTYEIGINELLDTLNDWQKATGCNTPSDYEIMKRGRDD